MKRPRVHLSRIPERPPIQTVDHENTLPRFGIGREMARHWQKSLSGIPRWGRILIVAVMSLAVTLVVFPQVDGIYMDHFFNNDTVIIPSYVSAGLGLITYIAGWFLVVGSRANKPHEQVSSSPALLWYIGLGTLALIVCTVLLVYGLAMMNASSGVSLDVGV